MSIITSYISARATGQPPVFFLLVKESRPVVLLLAAMRFAAGALVAEGTLPGPESILAGLAWLLVVAGIYLTNASADIVADTINRKQRPLAQGMLSKHQVDRAAIYSFAGAAILGFQVGPVFLALVTLMGLIGIFYSVGPKPGKNHFLSTVLIVAVGIALPYLGGSLAAHGAVRNPSLIAGILLGCWAAVASISKDFADVAGDTADGRRTLPVAFGRRTASLIAAAGSMAVAVAVPILAMNSPHPDGLWVLPVGALAFAITCVTLSAGQGAVSPGAPYRVFMLTQIATNGALIALSAALIWSSI